MTYVGKILIVLIIFGSVLTLLPVFGSPMLEVQPPMVDIQFDESSQTVSTNTDIPVILSIIDAEIPLKSYKLNAFVLSPFSSEQDFEIQLKPAIKLLQEGIFFQETYILDSLEQTIFQNIEPSFAMQALPFNMDILIPMDAVAGTYTATVHFIVYEFEDMDLEVVNNFGLAEGESYPFPLEGGLPFSEGDLLITVTIAEILMIEVQFGESGNSSLSYLEFGLIDPLLERDDQQVIVMVMSNLGRPYRLIQRRDKVFVSEIYQAPFNAEGIFFEIDPGANLGRPYYLQPSPLLPDDDFIFESDSRGSSEIVSIIYSVQNIPSLIAGRYTTLLSYFVEPLDGGDPFPEVKVTFDVFVEVKPEFYFHITPENKAFNMDFTPKSRGVDVQDINVKVEVFSNLGRQYRLFHSLPVGLLNDKGGMYPEENFLYVITDQDGNSISGYEFKSTAPFDQLLFESDIKGLSTTFFVRYRLNTLDSQMNGLYRSDLHFSLTTD